MRTDLGRWLAALALCTVAVTLSVLFLDRPLALFLHDHVQPHRKIWLVLFTVPFLAPLGALAILACGVLALMGRAPPLWLATVRLAGYSLMWALVSTVMVLKPLLGRANIEMLYRPPTFYGFHLLGGTMQSSFPSGHAAAVAAVFTVLWTAYPRLRWLWAVIAGALMVALVASNWHFAGDIMAGLFIGASAAVMTVRQWNGAPKPG